MNKSNKTIIIGAGLSGLTLAMLFEQAGMEYTLLEARSRVGGRILTMYEKDKAPLEMGATWFGKKHHHVVALLKSMNIQNFEQLLGKTAIYEPISTSPPQVVQLPSNDEPSYRISGGTSALVAAIEAKINPKNIKLNTPVRTLAFDSNQATIYTDNKNYAADAVVNTIPPYLFLNSIETIPALPESLKDVLTKTHTWMGESIKVGLRYTQPFWRKNRKSGTIFSNVGPIPEMYDHSTVSDDHYALVGFLNGTYYSVSREERKNMVLGQLEKYYGKIVYDMIEYEEKVWSKEHYTFTSYSEHVLPHQNNGHPLFLNSYMNGRLIFSGSETATAFPGYLDGAIESAFRVYNLLTK